MIEVVIVIEKGKVTRALASGKGVKVSIIDRDRRHSKAEIIHYQPEARKGPEALAAITRELLESH